jgi:hypothetical protein
MSLFGRYYSERDLQMINSINAELMGDIIETLVVCFKIAAEATNTNIYGESSTSEGKSFYDGIQLSALIERNDPSTDDEGFGPDRDQTVVFKLRQNTCADANYFPEVGDLILFNNRYHEINNIVQEQLLGGQSTKSHSFICNTHYSRLSKLNIVERS